MAYSEEFTKDETYNLLKELNINSIQLLYKAKEVKHSCTLNWNGITKDTNEKYINIISKILYMSQPNIIDWLDKILEIERKSPFPKRNERKNIRINKFKSISEKDIAENINNINELGSKIEFEIPLKASNKDKGVGKIDLLTYDERKGVSIIELKSPNSTEGLLRAIFEIQTYYKQLHLPFIKEIIQEKLKNKVRLEDKSDIKKNIVLFNDTELSDNANSLYMVASDFCKNDTNFPFLIKIFDELKIDLYIYKAPEKGKGRDYKEYNNLSSPIYYRIHKD